MPPRYSRHYADTAALGGLPAVQDAIHDAELCRRVVQWKQRFFSRAWARYDLATRGTFRLVPSAERIAELESDYRAMEPMFFDKPPPFQDVLAALRAMESAINAGR